ncbi:MAG: amidohydrolase [Xanthomonadales bacterium]|nr:amidohydrolase [Xanthomonadales bacterium]
MSKLDNIRCLLVQSQLFWADSAANRRQLETITRDNAMGVDLVVFPETFTSGFLGDMQAGAEPMNGETVQWMLSLASELGCVLCGSVAITTERGTANRFLWAQPDGQLQFYDKRHLFSFGGEDRRYIAGDERKVFRYRGWRICPQVCYDLRFPVWCRNRDDYDLLIFVANWPDTRAAAWSALLRARAIENQCYVIGVNRSGKDPRGLQYQGDSAVYDPLGELVLDLGSEENAASKLLHLDKIRSTRRLLPFQRDADEFKIF